MNEQNGSPPERPSLRIAELSIENFRTFRGRTVIPFSDGGAAADSTATLHGRNGSGKSNALAALDLLFRATLLSLVRYEGLGYKLVWDEGKLLMPTLLPVVFRHRDRPAGAESPTEIAVRFAEDILVDGTPVRTLVVRLTPEGASVDVTVEHVPGVSLSALRESSRKVLLGRLQVPKGPGSRPFAILDARRRASWIVDPRDASDALTEELFRHRTSRIPEQRERWRAFLRVLDRFPTLHGKEISVDRLDANGAAALLVEDRGRSVLALDELSSGERQIVLLAAAVFVADASIVAIEEPELSLDVENQGLLLDLLQAQIDAGLVDQLILESHVPTFDGPHVIRFEREPVGGTRIRRESTASAESLKLKHLAEAQGAKQRWVTGDGFTRLPDAMRDELEVGTGKHVWFLRGPERWEAWPEEELDQMLGGAPEAGHE